LPREAAEFRVPRDASETPEIGLTGKENRQRENGRQHMKSPGKMARLSTVCIILMNVRLRRADRRRETSLSIVADGVLRHKSFSRRHAEAPPPSKANHG
jgi:hypothetical protein